MKTLCLLFILAVGCNSSQNVYNELTQAEKDELTQKKQAKCASDNKKDFEDLRAYSNGYFPNYTRGKVWKLNTTGASTTTTSMYVWNNNANGVYLLYKYTDGVPKYKFFKLTTATNDLILADVQNKKCIDVTNRVIGDASATMTIAINKVTSIDAGLNYETDTTYTYREVQPAFFNAFATKVTVRKYKTDNTLDTTTTTTATFADPIDGSADLLADYTLYTSANVQYCVVLPIPGSSPVSFANPLNIPCQALSNPTDNANTSGDARFDFRPNELLL